MSNKKQHRARQQRRNLIRTSSVDTRHDNSEKPESRSALLAKSMVAAHVFKIVYLVPHLPQDLESVSFLGWYSEGLHEAAGPLISIAEMPGDIRELFTDRTSQLVGRLNRQISRRTTPISIDSLERNLSILNDVYFKVIVSNNVEVSRTVDSFISKIQGPVLHVSPTSGVGRISPNNFNNDSIIKYCREVVEWMSSQEKYQGLARIADSLMNSENPRGTKKVNLPKGYHNVTTPNETALRAFGFELDQAVPVSEPWMEAGVTPKRYVDRICQSADIVTNSRLSILKSVPKNLIDHRYILAVQSFYWGHFGGFRKRISDAENSHKDVFKLLFSGTVQASTYFDVVSTASKEVMRNPLFQYLKKQQSADAASFTAGITTISSSTLVPVLRLEPKLNRIRGDLKQIGNCARSNRKGKRRKLSILSRKLGARMRTLIQPEFLKRIDAANLDEIEGMKLVADIPLELLLSNNIPLSLRFDISRLPVLPGNLYLANCMPSPITLKFSKFLEIIVIRSFSSDDLLRNVFDIAISAIAEKLQPNLLKIKIVDVASEDDFVNALKDFNGAIMIYDGHGSYNRNIGAGELVIGGKSIDAWQLKKRITVPPIVIFSACDTQPMDGSHSSAATAAFALGAKAVVGTMLPINGLNAGIFIGRMLLRINEFVPIAVKVRRLLTWREVVSGMIRMSHVTDVLSMLEINMADIYSGPDYRQVQMVANIAINNRNPKWHDEFINALSHKVMRERSKVVKDLEKWGSLTESLKYVHLGNPEDIVIVEDAVFEELFGDGHEGLAKSGI